MVKSRSQGDSIDKNDVRLVFSPHGSTDAYRRPPRVHLYEEIRPKLVYADIDLVRRDLQGGAKSSSAHTSPGPRAFK